jgi:hypothetical protein
METKGFSNKALAAALAAIVGGCVAANAQAGALATSIHQFSNFQIIDNDDNQALDTSDFSSGTLSYTNGSDIDVSLNGATDGASDPPLDLPVQCLGDCPAIAENTYPVVSSGLGDPSSTFAAGDTNIAGSPITGLGFPLGGTLEAGSYVSLSGGDQTGSTNANNDLSSTFEFALAKDGGLTFQFDAESYLEAFTSSDQVAPADANASYSFGFTIRDLDNNGNIVMRWRPDGQNQILAHTGITAENDPYSLNEDISRNAPANGVTTAEGVLATKSSGSFWASTVNLTAGTTYQLTSRLITNADAETVPTPGVLALMGVGLIGMGAATRRRRSLSA